MYLTQGLTVHVQRLTARPVGGWALAGKQMKLTADLEEFEGTVVRVLGDDPAHPKRVLLVVRRRDGTEVKVEPRHIVGVSKPPESP